jgi:hypothetical protein
LQPIVEKILHIVDPFIFSESEKIIEESIDHSPSEKVVSSDPFHLFNIIDCYSRHEEDGQTSSAESESGESLPPPCQQGGALPLY